MAAYFNDNSLLRQSFKFYFFVVLVAVISGFSLVLFPVKIVAGIAAISVVFVLVFAPVFIDVGLVRFAFYLSVFLSIVWPRYIGIPGAGVADMTPSRIAILCMLLGAIKLLQRDASAVKRLSCWYRNNRILVNVFLLFVFTRLFSGVFSGSPLIGFFAFINEFVSYYLYFFIVPLVVESDKDLQRLFHVVVAGFFIVLCLSVLEWVVGHNLFSSLVAADSEYLESILRDKIRGGGARVQAVFVHPLSLAEFALYSFSFILVLFFISKRVLGRSILFVLLMGTLFVVYVTGSRAGLAISIVMVVVYWFLYSVRNGKAPFGLLVLLSFLPFMLIIFLEYDFIGHVKGQSLGEYKSGTVRLYMLERSLSLAIEQPFFGYGLKSAANVLGVVGAKSVVTIDSYYLSLLLDSGFLGLALYFLLSGIVIARFVAGNLVSRFLVLGLVFVLTFKAISSSPYNDYMFYIISSVVMLGRNTSCDFKILRGQS